MEAVSYRLEDLKSGTVKVESVPGLVQRLTNLYLSVAGIPCLGKLKESWKMDRHRGISFSLHSLCRNRIGNLYYDMLS